MELWTNRSEFKLENVEVQQRKHPSTFQIPPRRIRQKMRPYDFVKVILLLDHPPPNRAAERLWVRVTKVEANGSYVGKIDNEPVLVRAKLGDEIRFGPEHVADFRLTMALAEPVPSARPGYTHPAGRHVDILGGSETMLDVRVHVPPADPKGQWWSEKLRLRLDTQLKEVVASDPLVPDYSSFN